MFTVSVPLLRFWRCCYACVPVVLALALCASCSKTIGWGVLLWYTEDPPIPSGTVLPVYVRSNIEQLWIAGIPAKYRKGDQQMLEIPLTHLELESSKRAAEKRAAELGKYAKTYAETLQDGLPVRAAPENNSRRIYRLRRGEVIKVLSKTEGAAAISTTGSPLSGDWLYILTKNGATGYCFSYRLTLFEHDTGPLAQETREIDTSGDSELDMMLSRTWYPESYGGMLASGNIDLDALSRHWGFDSGTESGTARIFLPDTDMSFPYSRIRKEAGRSWVFEGSTLKVSFNSESSILVHYEDENGKNREKVFVTLPDSVDNIIRREREKRAGQFQAIYVNGPAFHSVNYGTIVFTSDQRFTWGGIVNLPPGMLSQAALGSGSVDMGRYLDKELESLFSGAFSLVFDTVSGGHDQLTFLYSLETQGIRLEYVPPENMLGAAVARRASSPLVIYFSAGSVD